MKIGVGDVWLDNDTIDGETVRMAHAVVVCEQGVPDIIMLQSLKIAVEQALARFVEEKSKEN